MRNDGFWDFCTKGSIREKVASFIEHHPLLSKFSCESYYELEDSIVGLIEENSESIYREMEKEYHHRDLLLQACSSLQMSDEKIEQAFSHVCYHDYELFEEKLYDLLSDCEPYFDAYWACVEEAMKQIPAFKRVIEELNAEQQE